MANRPCCECSAGSTEPTAGASSSPAQVVDDGRRSLPPEQRRIGLVFQDHALFPHLTVAGNVGFGIRDREARPARVEQMLQLVGLTGYDRRYPHELSGGERQRVALARSLALEPALLLLDEPFASLDPNLRTRIRDEVVDILRSTGTPAVFVTHDQHEALAIGDRIAVMSSGRITQLDHPHTVFHQPANRFVASFMGDADFLTRARPEPSPLISTAPTSATRHRAHGASRRHRVHDRRRTPRHRERVARIVGGEFRGSTWCYTLRLSSGATIRALRSHLEPVEIGTAVTPGIKPGHHPVFVPA